jgi:hypothetical protein
MKIPKTNETGSARLKFLMVVAIIAACGYALYLYLPVAYQSFRLKDTMQHDVDVAVTQGYPPSWVHDQLIQSAAEYEMPTDAIIEPTQRDNRVEVRVRFTRPIQFPGYTYEYTFDHTARSTAFLTFK